MSAVPSVVLALTDEDGHPRARLKLSTLKSRLADKLEQPPLIDLRGAEVADGLEPVQLVESARYKYEVLDLDPIDPIDPIKRLDPEELFEPDDETLRVGRLSPGLHTGRLTLAVHAGADVLRTHIEVRSVKLGYLDDYRHMLEGIARLGTELVLQRFGATEQHLETDPERDAETLYQRFAMLRSLIMNGRVATALHLTTTQPYIAFRTSARPTPPGRPLRPSSALARRLAGPGPRVPWESSPHELLESYPHPLWEDRTEETLDNAPNRFVKFALEQFRAVAEALLHELDEWRPQDGSRLTPAPIERGKRQALDLIERLDDALRHPIFREVGRLDTFPASNQVLHKRAGYREIFEAFTLYEAGATLTWRGGDTVFGAGLRNVAALYEYWVFIELARIIARLSGDQSPVEHLFETTTRGLSLMLRQGTSLTLPCTVTRRGRTFSLELTYNRVFSRQNGSWSRTMRPDCSLKLTPLDTAFALDPLWLHFDAKYRVSEPADFKEDDPVLGPKHEDLLKMHTYRDAIVGAAGAYVIYPGTQVRHQPEHSEILPSLGAFPLKPSAGEVGEGADALTAFIEEVLDHLADQATQHERARYWHRQSFTGPPASTRRPADPFLPRPAADTVVVLGYLKSEAHAEWVQQHMRYNLRASPERRGALGPGDPALSAGLLVTFRRDRQASLFRVLPPVTLMTEEDLRALGYPEPGGKAYFVFALEPLPLPTWLEGLDLLALHQALAPPHTGFGAPLALTWAELRAHAEALGGSVGGLVDQDTLV